MIEDKLKDGEKYEDGEYAQFRLKWCGDDNNCFETKTHDVDERNFEDDFEDELRSWRETECQKGDFQFFEEYLSSKFLLTLYLTLTSDPDI